MILKDICETIYKWTTESYYTIFTMLLSFIFVQGEHC